MERFWICRGPSVRTDRVGLASTRGLFAALLVLAIALGMVSVGVSRAPAASASAASSATAPAGTGLAWGIDNFGQLGDGGGITTSAVPVPVDLPPGTTITAVAAGQTHSLALTSTGTVLAWGRNDDGQLGNGTNADSSVPVPVSLPAGTTITAIAAGVSASHSLALTSTGTVLAWGDNREGALGNGTTTNSNVPVPVSLPVGTTITDISAGGFHSLALTSTGTVLAWGGNGGGQLGNGTRDNSLVPVPVSLPPGTKITDISAGFLYSLAVTSTGSGLAWGNNIAGQLGNGTRVESLVPVPVNLPAGTTITAISAGSGFSLALTSTGTVLAWGDNGEGELGNGTTTNSLVPVPVSLPAGATITAIAAGGGFSLGLTSTGTVLAWGDNTFGKLGNGTVGGFSTVPVPVDLPAGTTITAIAAGQDHALAVAAEQAPPTSTTTLRVSPSDPQPKQPVTFTATVTCTAGTPTGNVTFLDGKKTVGTATLSGGPTATATLTFDRLRPGRHTIRARYNGNGTCPPSTSKPVTVKVQKQQLPVTGVNAPATFAAGILLVLTGTALVLRSHRRRPASRSNA